MPTVHPFFFFRPPYHELKMRNNEYYSHLLQKRREFLYPSEKRKGMEKKNYFFPY